MGALAWLPRAGRMPSGPPAHPHISPPPFTHQHRAVLPPRRLELLVDVLMRCDRRALPRLQWRRQLIPGNRDQGLGRGGEGGRARRPHLSHYGTPGPTFHPNPQLFQPLPFPDYYYDKAKETEAATQQTFASVCAAAAPHARK